jgi:hypothetical protein
MPGRTTHTHLRQTAAAVRLSTSRCLPAGRQWCAAAAAECQLCGESGRGCPPRAGAVHLGPPLAVNWISKGPQKACMDWPDKPGTCRVGGRSHTAGRPLVLEHQHRSLLYHRRSLYCTVSTQQPLPLRPGIKKRRESPCCCVQAASSPDQSAHRERIQEAIARTGEPQRHSLHMRGVGAWRREWNFTPLP